MSVSDDFQRLMVARADHRLLVFGAYTQKNAKDITSDLIRRIGDYQHSLPGDRYMFACWTSADAQFRFDLHVV